MRLLLAEDERDLNRIITKKLTSSGYSVDSFFDGQEAIDVLAYTDYDAVILDIMMPKADGFAVLRAIRDAGKTTPVLFLTARDAVSDRVKGLDSGANDYLIKPFSFDELLARIRAMTRTSFGAADNLLTVADITLDTRPRWSAGRAGGDALGQGVRPAGVPDAQPGHHPLPGEDRKPYLEPGL